MFDPFNDTEVNDYSGANGSTTMNDNWLSDFLKAGSGLGGAYLNRNNTPAAAPVATPAKTNWLPFAALGGVVLLLIIGIIALRPRP